MLLKLTLDLPEERACIKLIRVLSRALLEHLRAIEQDVDEVEVVVGELCANVVRHAQSMEGRFRVTFEYHANRVVVTVEDRGSGFSAQNILPVGTERPDFSDTVQQRIGGYGLQIVELLSDRLEFVPTNPQGTTVRAEKHLHFPPRAEGDKCSCADEEQNTCLPDNAVREVAAAASSR